MSTAMKCDRCNKYYDNYSIDEKLKGNGIKIIYGIVGAEVKKIDLCPACAEELYDWINAGSNRQSKTPDECDRERDCDNCKYEHFTCDMNPCKECVNVGSRWEPRE